MGQGSKIVKLKGGRGSNFCCLFLFVWRAAQWQDLSYFVQILSRCLLKVKIRYLSYIKDKFTPYLVHFCQKKDNFLARFRDFVFFNIKANLELCAFSHYNRLNLDLQGKKELIVFGQYLTKPATVY